MSYCLIGAVEEDLDLVEKEQWEEAALAGTVQAHLRDERQRVAAEQLQRKVEERQRQREAYASRQELQER